MAKGFPTFCPLLPSIDSPTEAIEVLRAGDVLDSLKKEKKTSAITASNPTATMTPIALRIDAGYVGDGCGVDLVIAVD